MVDYIQLYVILYTIKDIFLSITIIHQAINFLSAEKVNPYKSFVHWLETGRKEKKILNQRNHYNDTLKSEDYIQWSEEILARIYGKVSFTTVLGKAHPVACFENANPISYPFTGIMEDNLITEYSTYRLPKSHTTYRQILGKTLKKPKNAGYMLCGIQLDSNDRVLSVSAKAGKYGENVDTSQILEYELYQVYRADRDEALSASGQDLLELFPIRKAIHNDRTPQQVLRDGKNRASLLGVQVFILFKHPGDELKEPHYRTLLIERSDDVAVKPGYHQFIPSGGFEVWSDNTDQNTLNRHYSLRLAIFREYLEEVFGIIFCETNEKGEPVSNILKHEKIQKLLSSITNNDCFQFLGSVVDLVGLRHELSFILRIDATEFAAQTFHPNHEGKALNDELLEKLEDLLVNKKFNQGSAGLFHLASKHPLYTEAIGGKAS